MTAIALYEEKFVLFDRIPAGVCVLRQDFVVLFWNHCLETWTKIPRSEIVGNDIGEKFPHLKQPLYASRLLQIFEGGPPTIFSSQLHQHIIPAPFSQKRLRIQQTTVTANPALTGPGFDAILVIQDVTALTHQSQAYREMRDRALSEVEERCRIETALRESEERFRKIFEEGPLGMAIIDFDDRLLKVNAMLCQMTGYTEAELSCLLLLDLTHPDDRNAGRECTQQLFEGQQQSCKSDRRLMRKDRSLLWTTLTESTIRDEAGNALYTLAMIEDITERKQSEKALQAANERLQIWVNELEVRNSEIAMLAKMSDVLQACLNLEEAYSAIAKIVQLLFPSTSGGVFSLNADRTQLEVRVDWGAAMASQQTFKLSQCCALIQGYPKWLDEARHCPFCQHIHQNPPPSESLCIPMIAQGETLGLLYLNAAVSGQLPESKRQLAITVAEHIALALANLKLRETLRQQSIRDPLTGLFNRRYLEESLEQEIHRAQRKAQSLGVVMIDIDRFKHFNDTFGHKAGDTVLVTLGLFLKERIRGSDIACRYGGEELLLILPEASLEAAQRRAEQLRQGVRELKIQYQGQPLGHVTISLGVACFPQHGLCSESLIRAADAALYRAKREGRDRTIIQS